jgi:PhnB protein
MTASASAVPEGYHSVTPYLAVDDAAAAIAFYKEAFGAREVMRMPAPGGKIGHAEVEIGGSRVMLADEYPDMNFRSPKAYGGTPVTLHLYVADVDAVARQAVAAGAREVRPVEDQFYGDRTGTFEDPFGHVWHLATRKEDVSAAELKRRAEKAMQRGG